MSRAIAATAIVILALNLPTLLLAGAVAAIERALTLRRNRVLDAETLWTNF